MPRIVLSREAQRRRVQRTYWRIHARRTVRAGLAESERAATVKALDAYAEALDVYAARNPYRHTPGLWHRDTFTPAVDDPEPYPLSDTERLAAAVADLRETIADEVGADLLRAADRIAHAIDRHPRVYAVGVRIGRGIGHVLAALRPRRGWPANR
jgi:hypothetical protein